MSSINIRFFEHLKPLQNHLSGIARSHAENSRKKNSDTLWEEVLKRLML